MRHAAPLAILWLAAACGGASRSADGGSDDGDAAEAAPDAAEETEDDGETSGETAGDDGTPETTTWEGDVPELPRLDKAEHIASCMRTRACFPENPQQLATCTSAFAHVSGREVGYTLAEVARCVNAAGADCEAVRACLTNGEPPAACVPLSTPDRCEGTVLRQCSRASSLDFVFDCARIGLGCYLDAEGTAVCGLGTCNPDTFRWTCRGDTVVACDLGVITLAQCDVAGLHCVEDEAGGRCAGGGAPCTDDSDPRRCEGSHIRGCIAGSSADVDCNTVVPRWTCGDAGGAAGCVAPGAECSALPLFGSDIDESCDGEAVVTCLDGWIESLSCAALGLGPCVVLPSGHAARCTVP
ncbi:MAG: hypothetical protein GYA57_13170 [Myxococcales bacterium]|nr:hypothetical protein [Myxococcales bacterium]